jgi:hypothetical protein
MLILLLDAVTVASCVDHWVFEWQTLELIGHCTLSGALAVHLCTYYLTLLYVFLTLLSLFMYTTPYKHFNSHPCRWTDSERRRILSPSTLP